MNLKVYQEKLITELRNIHQKIIRKIFQDFLKNMK